MIEISIEKVDSTTIRYIASKNGSCVRDINIKLHYTYMVDSLEDEFHKHQGKRCIIMGFAENDYVDVRYIDTQRRGKVHIQELNTIEDGEDIRKKLVNKKVEFESLLNSALVEKKRLNERIEAIELELLKIRIDLRE